MFTTNSPTFKDISIHVPREGHDLTIISGNGSLIRISIHVPREGHDFIVSFVSLPMVISIHVPREGHD